MSAIPHKAVKAASPLPPRTCSSAGLSSNVRLQEMAEFFWMAGMGRLADRQQPIRSLSFLGY